MTEVEKTVNFILGKNSPNKGFLKKFLENKNINSTQNIEVLNEWPKEKVNHFLSIFNDNINELAFDVLILDLEIFSEEEITKNLNLKTPVTFGDPTINNKKSDFIELQKESFLKRYNEQLKKEKSLNKSKRKIKV